MSKVALITGAGKKRIGNVVARALADKGFDVAIHYRTSEKSAEQLKKSLVGRGVNAETFQGDLRSDTDVDSLTTSVFKHFKRVDVLVNCAAIWRPVPLEDIDTGELLENYETNTLGTFLTCQKVGLRMTKQRSGGVIVNLGDWAPERPYLDYAAYMASKGSIPTLTRTFAHELAARNPKVRVNCVLPGPVMLPKDMPAAIKEKVINGTLLKKEGSPKSVAHAVLFLIENDFVTGVSLPVDGGRSIYAPDDTRPSDYYT